ncbi:MAG: hypothetical protein AABX70_07515 [Nanoarchaeota archaeon]
MKALFFLALLVLLTSCEGEKMGDLKCIDSPSNVSISGKSGLNIPCVSNEDCAFQKASKYCSPAIPGYSMRAWSDFCSTEGYCKQCWMKNASECA